METFEVGFLLGFLSGSIAMLAVAIVVIELGARRRHHRPVELDGSLEALRRLR